MHSVKDRIENLISELEDYRKNPKESGFTDNDHILTYVELELEDCMVELLSLPIPEHRSLLDRVIQGVHKLGTVGKTIEKIISLFH